MDSKRVGLPKAAPELAEPLERRSSDGAHAHARVLAVGLGQNKDPALALAPSQWRWRPNKLVLGCSRSGWDKTKKMSLPWHWASSHWRWRPMGACVGWLASGYGLNPFLGVRSPTPAGEKSKIKLIGSGSGWVACVRVGTMSPPPGISSLALAWV